MIRRRSHRATPIGLGDPPVSRRSRSAPDLRADDAYGAVRRISGLELTVVRRLDGLLQGGYRGRIAGPGSEPGESRAYQTGDDYRRMDWKLTARTGAPMVRDVIADRELEVWIVADRSPSLDFGTAALLKRDLVLGAAAGFGFLAARSGSRVGAVVFGAGPAVTMPARIGRQPVREVLRRLEDRPRPREEQDTDIPSTLEDALRVVPRVARDTGIVLIVSDFLAAGGWERPLRALRSSHDVVAVEVVDPVELELPDVGLVVFQDPETGAQLEVPTGRRDVRARYAASATAFRTEIRDTLRHAAADHVVLRTDSDWVVDLARYLRRRRRTAWLTHATANLAAR
jgi:uncharacterized protein (DUF58 family)